MKENINVKINRFAIMADVDSRRESPIQLRKRFRWLSRKLWPGIRWRTYCRSSPSGKGWHFWALCQRGGYSSLTLEERIQRQKSQKLEFHPLKILLCQCLLGSDIRRERANLSRIASGVKAWNRLFVTRRQKFEGVKKYLTNRNRSSILKKERRPK